MALASRTPYLLSTTPPSRGAGAILLLLLLTAPAASEPDSTGILRIFSQRIFGHGCPVGETEMFTARHVALPENRSNYVVWSTQNGVTGSAWVEDSDLRRDLARMRSDTPFPHVYRIAAEIPTVGDRVLIVGYNYSKSLQPKILSIKVENVVAGHLVLSPGATRGFSGSCVLNEQNEVVAILTGGVGQEERPYGIAPIVVGVWGDVSWRPTSR